MILYIDIVCEFVFLTTNKSHMETEPKMHIGLHRLLMSYIGINEVNIAIMSTILGKPGVIRYVTLHSSLMIWVFIACLCPI